MLLQRDDAYNVPSHFIMQSKAPMGQGNAILSYVQNRGNWILIISSNVYHSGKLNEIHEENKRAKNDH